MERRVLSGRWTLLVPSSYIWSERSNRGTVGNAGLNGWEVMSRRERDLWIVRISINIFPLKKAPDYCKQQKMQQVFSGNPIHAELHWLQHPWRRVFLMSRLTLAMIPLRWRHSHAYVEVFKICVHWLPLVCTSIIWCVCCACYNRHLSQKVQFITVWIYKLPGPVCVPACVC